MLSFSFNHYTQCCFTFLVPRSCQGKPLSILHLPEHDFTTSFGDLIQWSKQTGMSLCDSLTFSPLSSEVIYVIQSVSPPNHAFIFLMCGLCVDWMNCLIKYYMTHNHTRCLSSTSCTAQILCVIPFLDRASFWQNDILYVFRRGGNIADDSQVYWKDHWCMLGCWCSLSLVKLPKGFWRSAISSFALGKRDSPNEALGISLKRRDTLTCSDSVTW